MAKVYDHEEEKHKDCKLCGGTDGTHRLGCPVSFASWELPMCKKCGENHPFAGPCKEIEIPDTVPENWG